MFKTNDININGSIGYTLLENGNNKVLILSDMHSELPYCEKNGIFVSDWMKSKTKSKILLEEVPRTDSTLKELWPSSPHTQKLKDLYLSKQNAKLLNYFPWKILNVLIVVRLEKRTLIFVGIVGINLKLLRIIQLMIIKKKKK